MARLILQIELGSKARISAEGIQLLELVEKTGSISAAGRAHGFKFRRAWTLLGNLNRMFKTPLVTARSGGPDGGGACLTAFGREVIDRYRAIESIAAGLTADDLAALEASVDDGAR